MLDKDFDAGVVAIADVDLANLLVLAERVSRARTDTGGHRSFDVLHIAAALEMEADVFLSFDANQNVLAAAEGLATPLAASAPKKNPRRG